MLQEGVEKMKNEMKEEGQGLNNTRKMYQVQMGPRINQQHIIHNVNWGEVMANYLDQY